MIEVELPDGTIVEFPDGTSRDVIKSALQKRFAKQAVIPAPGAPASPQQAYMEARARGEMPAPVPMDNVQATKQAAIDARTNAVVRRSQADQARAALTAALQFSPAEAALFGASQGVTFGTADEVVAGLVALFPNQTYAEELPKVRAMMAAAQEQNPVTSTAANIGGAVVTLPIGGIAARAASLGPRVLTIPNVAKATAAGVGIGATEGAVHGFGAGEGGFINRLKSSGQGAVVGGATGGVIGAASPAIGRGIKNIIDRFKQSDVKKIAAELGISENAAKIIKNNFDTGGSIDDAMDALKRAGDDGMLADAGFASQQLLDTTIQQGGEAGRIGRQAVDARTAMMEPRLRGTLDAVLGEPQGIKSLQRSIREGSAASRGKLYDEAYAAEIDYRSPAGEQLRALIESTPDDVLRNAAKARQMESRPDNALAMYAGEFEPSVSVKAGEFAGNYAEKQEIQQFFKELKGARRESFMKRPFTNTFKELGVDPSGRLAQELRSRGITPQTTVGLFRVGGLKEADNIDIEWFPVGFRNALETDGNYVSQQSIIDALESELRGVPVDTIEKAAARSDLSELENAEPEYLARRMRLGKEDAEFSRRAPTAPKDIATRGDVMPSKTFRDVDDISRALNEIRYSKDGGVMGGPSKYQVEAGKRAKEMRSLLGEISPAYKDALSAAQDTIERVNAVKFGGSLLNVGTKREDVAQFVADATDAELRAAASGIRQYIDDVMANVKQNISNPNVEINQVVSQVKMLSSEASREKIAAVVGSENASQLFRVLDQAMAQLELRGAVSRGSATAARLSGKAVRDQLTAPSAYENLARGKPSNAMQRAVQAITGYTDDFMAKRGQDIDRDVARALTEKRGKDAQAALIAIDQFIKDNPVLEAQSEQLIRKLMVGLTATGAAATRNALAQNGGN